MPKGTGLAWLTWSGSTDPPSPARVELHVGGVAADAVHLDWIDANLDVGDEIVLRVRDTVGPDPARGQPPDAVPEGRPPVEGPSPRPGRREGRRFDIFVDFVVRRIGPRGEIRQEERTIAENVSRGGARILTTMPLSRGDTVHLEELGGPFESRAEVRGTYVGKDGLQRLNLKFETTASFNLIWGDSDPAD
jgi:hypothetical protein